MKIVVAGGSGFIGEPLVRRLVARGDEVAVLTRNPSHVRAGRPLQWDARYAGAWSNEAAHADVIVNLAGENIGEGRWTSRRKERLIASRVDATNVLVSVVRDSPARSRTFVNASAVGLYGDRGDELLDESAPRGGGFLADLVEKWESAARGAEPHARLAILRFGVVLARDGGALKKMLPPFRLGIGGPIASGRQWMSWIDREDVVSIITWAIDQQEVRGVYNATAPEPVRNRDFTRALGDALHRPAIIPIPGFALRAMFGQMAEETLIAGQRVLPARAEREGFNFASPSVDEALKRALSS